MINIQKALKFASQFISKDKINKAIDLSKNVKSPQDAIRVLSSFGNPSEIVNDGLNKLNTPMAKNVARMWGVTDFQIDELKKEILGFKQQSQQSNSRLDDLINGLK